MSSINGLITYWISNVDTFFVGSISNEGRLDVSYRGGKKGFVEVLDDATIKVPDFEVTVCIILSAMSLKISEPGCCSSIMKIERRYNLQGRMSYCLTKIHQLIWKKQVVPVVFGHTRFQNGS